MSGDAIAAGAPHDGAADQGAVFVFVKPGEGWADATETAKRTLETVRQLLGRSVALSGETLAAGAPGDGAAEGAAYVFATGPSPEWIRQYGTAGFDGSFNAAVHPVSGFETSPAFVVGGVDGALPGQSSAGGVDAFLRRYDAAGNVQWTRQFGSTGTDVAWGIDLDESGYVYVAGHTSGALSAPNQGGFDIFVRKYTAAGGTLVWQQQYGTLGNDTAYDVDADQRVTWVGGEVGGKLFGQTWAGGADAVLVYLDSETGLRGSAPVQFGTAGDDRVLDISQSSIKTRLHFAGQTGGTLPGQVAAGGLDAFVGDVPYPRVGPPIWIHQFGTPGFDAAIGVGAIPASSTDSSLEVVGTVENALPGQVSQGGFDAFVRRYASSGSVVWTRQFGTPGTDVAVGVGTDRHSGRAFVVGRTEGDLEGAGSMGGLDAFVRAYEADGTLAWTSQFGTPADDIADRATVALGTGTVYVVGRTFGKFPGELSSGGADAFLAKLVTG